MKGVVLAGGQGTRLAHLTEGINKQAHPVFEKPMIAYPLGTLAAMGCKDVIIVASPEGLYDVKGVVDDGSELGLNIEYAIQKEPRGMADALHTVRDRVEGVFPLLCGDVFFDPPLPSAQEPTLFCHEFELGHNHICIPRGSRKLIKRPTPEQSQRAVVGYYLDDSIFEAIPRMQPSGRGEIEFDGVYAHYLERGVRDVDYDGFFGDMGTPAGLSRVANYLLSKARSETDHEKVLEKNLGEL